MTAYDEELDDLDEWIQRLRVEYEIFFNGHRKKAPEDLKQRVEKQVKRLAEANMSFTQRFRYNTLIGRYYIYRDHWRRRQADREQGLDFKSAAKAAPEPARERDEGIQITIHDPEADADKIKQLYEWLVSIRNKHLRAQPAISYSQFSQYVAAQTQGLKRKLGCDSVVFRITLEADAIKFTAKGARS